ncbi:MAG: hypothetical protein JNL87_08010 [Burkholderiaceae bacterium]|nr:hypothetical protein [Burkholderiaceae bacterium]
MDDWSLVSPLAIQIDGAGQVWHAGRVNAVLQFGTETSLLVGADQGGVWRVTSLGEATAFSDAWDNPNVLCLAAGPDASHHAYAGCDLQQGEGALWMSDPNATEPLSSWRRIALPAQTRGVKRILVLRGVRRIVLATQRGLWVSAIPPRSDALRYSWSRVGDGLPLLGSDTHVEVAEGPAERVVAAIGGFGMFLGDWEAGSLRMRAATLPASVSAAQIQRSSICACAANRRMMWAVSGNDGISALLASTDGGASWQSLKTQVIGQPPGTTVAQQAGDSGWHNQCIAVSPVSSSTVALGWRVGGPFVSQDGGHSWQKFDQTDPALHGDLNALVFSPQGSRLFIGSDGGVVSAEVVNGPASQPFLRGFASLFNRKLATLQFSGWPSRSAWASGSVDDSFAAGGLQDNGNVFMRWRDRSAWRQVGDSDGQLTLLLGSGDLLFSNTSDRTHATLASWNGSAMSERGVVPLRSASGSLDASGLTGEGSPRELFVVAVRAPALNSLQAPPAPIRAVAGVGSRLFGLFGDALGTIGHHWEALGTLSLASGEFITAVASHDGVSIFAGCNTGRIVRFAARGGPQSAAGTVSGGIVRRLLVDASAGSGLRGFGSTDQAILQLAPAAAAWTVLGPVTPSAETIFDLAVDWTDAPPRLFAATDGRVFSSVDGRQWADESRGLPKTPHGATLQIAGGRVFLGTFGRSLWSASLLKSWSPEEDLGGVLGSAPGACSWGPGRVDAFYRGANNHLWHRWFDGGWHAEEDLGGGLGSAPAACSWGPGRVDIFYRGGNGHLWHRWFDGGWQAEEDLGGGLRSAPAACTWGPGRVDTFYRGGNNHLWHRWFDGGWHAEEDLGGVLNSAPAACTWGAGRVDTFYCGQRSQLVSRSFDGHWRIEQDLGGVLTEAPAACAWRPRRMDIFYRGQNQHLWHRAFPV